MVVSLCRCVCVCAFVHVHCYLIFSTCYIACHAYAMSVTFLSDSICNIGGLCSHCATNVEIGT